MKSIQDNIKIRRKIHRGSSTKLRVNFSNMILGSSPLTQVSRMYLEYNNLKL